MYETNIASPLTWDIFSQQERKISGHTRKDPQVKPGCAGGVKVLKQEAILTGPLMPCSVV